MSGRFRNRLGFVVLALVITANGNHSGAAPSGETDLATACIELAADCAVHGWNENDALGKKIRSRALLKLGLWRSAGITLDSTKDLFLPLEKAFFEDELARLQLPVDVNFEDLARGYINAREPADAAYSLHMANWRKAAGGLVLTNNSRWDRLDLHGVALDSQKPTVLIRHAGRWLRDTCETEKSDLKKSDELASDILLIQEFVRLGLWNVVVVYAPHLEGISSIELSVMQPSSGPDTHCITAVEGLLTGESNAINQLAREKLILEVLEWTRIPHH